MSLAYLAEYAFKKFPSAAVILITDDDPDDCREYRFEAPDGLAERTETWSFPATYLGRLKAIDEAEALQMAQIAEARRHGVEIG